MSNLRRELDHYTTGALSSMNQACQTIGAQGHITVTQEENGTQTFIFSAYQGGQTQYFQKVTVRGAEHLVEKVQLSEEIRLLRKAKAGFVMNPAQAPRKTVWN